MGIITTPVYTKNGKATGILTLNENILSGMANIMATVDKQSIPATVTKIPVKAILTIRSTALDPNSGHWAFNYENYYELEEIVWGEFGMGLDEYLYMMYGDPYAYDVPGLVPGLWDYSYEKLNLIYEIPLNGDVTWVSVLWKPTDKFKGEVNVIVNGQVVKQKEFFNEAYSKLRYYYPDKVFNAILGVNKILEPNADKNDPLAAALWDAFKNGFTNQEVEFIKNYRTMFMDALEVTLSYPGDDAKTINISSAEDNTQITLNFPGNPVQRISPVIYCNGAYTHVDLDPITNIPYFVVEPAGYEGVRSFAIATTKVTDKTLRYWLDKKPLYQPGPMKAAYGTFLAALLVEKCHDMVADAAASQFNVSWIRTAPIVVSAGDEAYKTYLTLECDHRMGMTVLGEPDKVKAFRFACSSAISPIEHWIMKSLFPDSYGNSVTVGLGQRILNGELLDIFMNNGFLVIKPAGSNDLVILIDPATGIVRDILTASFCGAYCYYNQQTEWASDLGNKLLTEKPEWLSFTSSACITAGSTVFVGETLLEVAAASASTVVGVILAAAIIDAYLIINYPDITIPAHLTLIPVIGPVISSYAIRAALEGEDPASLVGKEQETFLKAALVLLELGSNDDIQKEIWKIYEKTGNIQKAMDRGFELTKISSDIPPDKRWDKVSESLRKACEKLRQGIKDKDPLTILITGGAIAAGVTMIGCALADAAIKSFYDALENIRRIKEEELKSNLTSNTMTSGSGG